MKGKYLFQAFFLLLVVGLFIAACGTDSKTNPYLYYTASGCPTSAPLYCPTSGKCCQSGNPYHCSDTGKCYSSVPSASTCPNGYDSCS